jgi:membrane protease YdiL (CAAX protease family)
MKFRIVIIVGILTFLINSTIIGLLFQTFPWTAEATFPEGGVWWMGQGWAIRIAYVGLLAPVLEEVVFRGTLLGWFSKRGREVPGLLVSGLAFGLYHMAFGWGWFKAVDMAFVGLVFGAVFLRYGLRGAASCHVANNLMSLVLMEIY